MWRIIGIILGFSLLIISIYSFYWVWNRYFEVKEKLGDWD